MVKDVLGMMFGFFVMGISFAVIMVLLSILVGITGHLLVGIVSLFI